MKTTTTATSRYQKQSFLLPFTDVLPHPSCNWTDVILMMLIKSLLIQTFFFVITVCFLSLCVATFCENYIVNPTLVLIFLSGGGDQMVGLFFNPPDERNSAGDVASQAAAGSNPGHQHSQSVPASGRSTWAR